MGRRPARRRRGLERPGILRLRPAARIVTVKHLDQPPKIVNKQKKFIDVTFCR
jgi:hypothetical protein